MGNPPSSSPLRFRPPGAVYVVLVLAPRTTALLFEPVCALESAPPLLVGGPRWREGLSYLVHMLRCPVGCLGGVFPGGPLPSSAPLWGGICYRCIFLHFHHCIVHLSPTPLLFPSSPITPLIPLKTNLRGGAEFGKSPKRRRPWGEA